MGEWTLNATAQAAISICSLPYSLLSLLWFNASHPAPPLPRSTPAGFFFTVRQSVILQGNMGKRKTESVSRLSFITVPAPSLHGSGFHYYGFSLPRGALQFLCDFLRSSLPCYFCASSRLIMFEVASSPGLFSCCQKQKLYPRAVLVLFHAPQPPMPLTAFSSSLPAPPTQESSC